MRNAMAVVVLSGLIVSGLASGVLAAQGFYLGLGIPYNTIGGDFDGESALIGANDVIAVPKIDSALGYGILFGVGFTPRASIELSYLVSSHSAKWLWGRGDVDYSIFNADFKYSFAVHQPTQPYLLVGLGVHKLVVNDGSQNAFTGAIGDATYTGTGFNLGLGLDHYINRSFSIGAGLIYRIVEYDRAKGVTDSGKIDSPLNGNGLDLLFSAAYHFSPGRTGSGPQF